MLSSLDRMFLQYVGEAKRWPPERTLSELEKFRGGGWKASSSSPSEFAFLKSAGCPLDVWLDRAEGAVQFVDAVPIEPVLKEALSEFRNYSLIALTTNSPWLLAKAVVIQLELEELVDAIFCPRAPHRFVKFPPAGKPSPSLYSEISKLYGVAASAVLVVGDRDAIDLTPARVLGMQVQLVRGPVDVARVLNERRRGVHA